MPNLHKVQVIVGPMGYNMQAFIDGQPVKGLRKFTLDQCFREATVVQFEIMVDSVEIEALTGDKGIVINRIEYQAEKAEAVA